MWMSWLALASAAPVLEAPPQVVLGSEVTVVVRDLPPGGGVAIGATQQLGDGWCPPQGGDCLDIRGGLEVLVPPRTVPASGQITATVRVGGAGTWYLQAMAVDPTAQVSQVVTVTSYVGWADTDGDGASNILELSAQTPPFDPDADGDGVLDGVDLWPFTPSAPPSWVADDLVVSDPTDSLPDPEFDTVTHQVAWQTADGAELWVADVDPLTGAFDPPDGRGTLLDTDVVPIRRVRNGPEWAQTATGARVLYGREVGGQEEIWEAAPGPSGWTLRSVAPGIGPIASLDPFDPAPRLAYLEDTGTGPAIAHTRFLDDPASDVAHATTLEWGRWVEGSDALIALAEIGGEAQVVTVDPTTAQLDVRTSTVSWKRNVFGWHAPEHGVEAFFHTAGPSGAREPVRLDVFLSDGAGGWTLHDQLRGPPGFPYIVSPEPLVVGGRSYIVFLASRVPVNYGNGRSEVWMVDIDPTTQFARRLSGLSGAVLKDPEPAVFGNRAFVYYSELRGTQRVIHRVIHRCETGL